MADDKINPQVEPTPLPAWGRPFAIAVAVVFLISLMFPVIAGLFKDTTSFPPWVGVLDVVIAFLLALMAFGIYALAKGRVTPPIQAATYRAYRILIHGIFSLLVVFLLFGDRITWINSLPGLVWRYWFLLYLLPEWLSILRQP